MRIATWNLNSVKARLPRLLTWLEQRSPDVLLVQETKATDATWPAAELERAGYASAHHGNGRWNGVAVLSRVGLSDVVRDLPGQPDWDDVVEPRAIGVTCNGVRLWSVYAPNGRTVGHPHYRYKLEFLARLRDQVAAERAALGADAAYGVLGDLNVAPTDADVWDAEAFQGSTHVTAQEREAVLAVQRTGPGGDLLDLLPRASADPADARPPYTFWEMRMLGFQKGRGMRIDLALVSPALAGAAPDVWVDRDARKGEGPSDHAPLVVDVER